MAVSSANLVTAAKTHANMQTGGPWTAQEWTDAVDRAMEALWLCVLAKQPTFRVTRATLTITAAATPSAALPATFLNALRVVRNAGTPSREVIPRYGQVDAGTPFQRTFRIEDVNLYIDPAEQSVGTYELSYNPRQTVPVVNMDTELEQHREFVELHVAIAALDAEESPSTALQVRLYGPNGAKVRVESWAARQRSSEPNRVRDVRGRSGFAGPRRGWSIP